MYFKKTQELGNSLIGQNFNDLVKSGFQNELGFEFNADVSGTNVPYGRVYFNHGSADITAGIEFKINSEGLITAAAAIRW